MSIHPTPHGLFNQSPAAPPRASIEVRPLARASDPQTSHQAAKRVRPKARSHAMQILRLIHERPGLTVGEMPQHIDIDRAAISKRIKGLVDDGFARKGEERQCRVAGTNQATLYPGSVPPPPGVLLDVTG